MTKIDIKPSYVSVKPSGFYVYVHLRATSHEPFYVGKGSGSRGWHHSSSKSRSELWRRCARKNGVTIQIAQCGMSEEDAYLLEEWLIAKFRHEGCNLYNIADGGSGGKGIRPGNSRPVVCSNGMNFETTGQAARWATGDNLTNGHSLIAMCCRGKIKSAYGYSWWRLGSDPVEYIDPKDRRIASRRRAVCCSNGMEFESTGVAASWLKDNGWPKASYINITYACSGTRYSAYEFAWWYADEEPKKYIDKRTLVSISVSRTWRDGTRT